MIVRQLLQQKIMDNTPYSKYPRKERMRTIGTTDSYDLNPSDSLCNQENKQRNGTHMRSLSKHKRSKKMENTISYNHNKSLNSAFVRSRVQEATPKCKVKRMMSITQNSRIKTEHSDKQHGPGFKKMVNQLRKKLIFPCEDNYKLQAFKILRMVHSRADQQLYTAKSGHPSKKYTLIKAKHTKVKYYQRQYKLREELAKIIPAKDLVLFLTVKHIWHQNKQHMVATDHYLNADWKDGKFYLFLNEFKTNPDALLAFMQQISAAIFVLAKAYRVHGRIDLQSVYFPLWKGNLKADKLIKLGHLSEGFKIEHKAQLKKMPISYFTPPEILNFILFEEGQPFDRDFLEVISELREPWQIDIWSLGILMLQLLNGGPLAGYDSDCHKLIELQRQLLIRYSYLLQKLDANLYLCLSNMLSLNPRNRPHPLALLRLVPEQ